MVGTPKQLLTSKLLSESYYALLRVLFTEHFYIIYLDLVIQCHGVLLNTGNYLFDRVF